MNIEYGRHFSYSKYEVMDWKNTSYKVIVGNFVSFADGVKIYIDGNHRTDFVTTYELNRLFEVKDIPTVSTAKGNVIIGSDVWIGNDATIMSGVTIGNGAVLGANTTVARDVPDYAIVVGNPGRIVKYRFTPEQIRRLLAIAWWNWPDEKIKSEVYRMLNTDIDAFINAHYDGSDERAALV